MRVNTGSVVWGAHAKWARSPPLSRPNGSARAELCLLATAAARAVKSPMVVDALVARGHVVLSDEGGEVTQAGERFLCSFGVDLVPPHSRRIYCKPCLDWSERRYHIKGVVGARILCRCMELGWFKRERDTRALRLTPAGTAGLRGVFGVAFGGVDGSESNRISNSAVKLPCADVTQSQSLELRRHKAN